VAFPRQIKVLKSIRVLLFWRCKADRSRSGLRQFNLNGGQHDVQIDFPS
jgi:hypothetical protein